MLLDALGFRSGTVDPKHPRDPAIAALFDFGAASAAGVAVSPDRALRSVAVYSCVRVIAETIAQLPLILYRRQGADRRDRAIDHPAFAVLRRRPNRFQTASEFKEMMQGHVLLRGNAYAEIVASGRTSVAELVPLHPDRVRPYWAPDGRRAYRHVTAAGQERTLLQDEMFHLMGLSTDGLKGVGPIELMRNAVGLDLAQEDYAGRQIANGVRPSGVLKHPQAIGPDAVKNLRESFEKLYSGADKGGKPIVLEEGLEWQQIGMKNSDAEFLDQRKFSATQIARMFRVPPHMIGDLEKATFSNIEQQALEFVQFAMAPWFVKWEEAAARDLLTAREQEAMYFEFLVDALLRGDQRTRKDSYVAGRQWGWLSANDVRRMENMNPIDGGDEYLKPLNMIPLGMTPMQGKEPTDGQA